MSTNDTNTTTTSDDVHADAQDAQDDENSADTNRVGPISFANDTARNQLVTDGEVVTFRPSERTTGETWWRGDRCGPKLGDAVVEHIGTVDPSNSDELEPHLPLSGFETVGDWQYAIRRLHGGSLPENGHLYRVTTDADPHEDLA